MSQPIRSTPRKAIKAIVPQKTGRGQSEEWEIPVWQFVRIMVQFEKNSSGKNTSIWKANQESWEELDQALSDAGSEDFDVFSQLMINTQVSLHLPDAVAKKTLNFALNSLLLSMRRRVKSLPKRAEERRDLEFEISELDKLHMRVMPVQTKRPNEKQYQPRRPMTKGGEI